MNVFLRMSFVVLLLALFVAGGAFLSHAENVQTLSGKVIETMNSAGYTYVRIENNGKKTWVAVPETKVVKGQNISFAPGMEMKDFESKTLKRKFDKIIFSEGVLGQKGAVSEKNITGGKGSAAAPTEKIKVEKATGADAYTVAEIYRDSKKLEKKKVVVRGKVVKVAANIMGKNWFHLQDGSGDAKTGTNDLILTSKDLPAVGDVVTASGTLYNDKDFGAGYRYAVIVENTSVKR
ncbi:MAG: DNA-binding protein [Nitrospirota bacterium]|nr:DNA-binding protein [Nitrospirota bacterium]